jgi:hypothetical protein
VKSSLDGRWRNATSQKDITERRQQKNKELQAMRDLEQQWNMQHEHRVEFKRKNDHCMVPRSYEQVKSLGKWASTQRSFHADNMLRLARKKLLDALGFVWKVEGPRDINDKVITDKEQIWQHQQHEKLVEFKQKTGRCRARPTRASKTTRL